MADSSTAEQEAVMADAVGAALLVVLEKLAPAERLAFVLHDMFAVPFDDIAPIVGRSSEAVWQLASRARRRVQGADVSVDADRARKRNIVRAFLAASRAGDFEALLAVLDPDVVFRADAAAVRLGPLAEIRGGKAVANTFKGRAQAAKPAIVEGGLGFPVMIGGVLKVVVTLTIDKDCITDINAIADPDRLGEITYRAFEED